MLRIDISNPDIVFKTLLSTIVMNNFTLREVADRAGIGEKTLMRKIKGEVEFTYGEMKRLRDVLAPTWTLDSLFREAFAKNQHTGEEGPSCQS